MELLKKQQHAVYYLNDDVTTKLLYGGGAGGGKTVLGVLWIISCCQKYPGIRCLFGRTKLSELKKSTLNTFFQQCSDLGLTGQYKYNDQSNTITWNNGSVIILMDLFLYPSDPNFDSLGSLELTFAFIDECNQVDIKAWNLVGSRLRYKLRDFAPNGELTKNLKVYSYEYVTEGFKTYENTDGIVKSYSYNGFDYVIMEIIDINYKKYNKIPFEWYQSDGKITKGLLGKTLGTCNPAKNWTYIDFYSPFKNGELDPKKKFIQSLPRDNPYYPESSLKELMGLDEASKKRLLYGDWDYDDNPFALFNFADLIGMFTNDCVKPTNDSYLTCDIAYTGSDRFVIVRWKGFVAVEYIVIDKISDIDVPRTIYKLKQEHNIPIKNIIYDADGLQTFTRHSSKYGFLRGATGFKNNGKPLKISGKTENFKNLKAQTYFYFAELVAEGGISIQDTKYKDNIIKEFAQICRKPLNDDGAIAMESKKDLKDRTQGVSPDLADATFLRAYPIIKGKVKPKIFW